MEPKEKAWIRISVVPHLQYTMFRGDGRLWSRWVSASISSNGGARVCPRISPRITTARGMRTCDTIASMPACARTAARCLPPARPPASRQTPPPRLRETGPNRPQNLRPAPTLGTVNRCAERLYYNERAHRHEAVALRELEGSSACDS